MSSINLKSITGITSITTPAGVDNVFTVHTNDTVERFRIDQSGNQRIAGILTVTQDLDVDGHTELDNVNISGLTTAALLNVNNLTNGRVTYAGGSGRLVDSANLTFNGSNLTVGGNVNATTFVGNLTGNADTATAATRVTVTDQSSDPTCNVLFTQAATGNLTPHSGSNLTFNSSTGALTATSFVGDGSNLTGITGVTINDNVNNRLVTATGTTGTLQGESNLTFDGTNLSIGGNVPEITLTDANASGTPVCKFSAAGGNINFQADTGSGKSDTYIAFSSDGSEKLRITSGGNVRVTSGVIENANTISVSYTVSTNFNAMSAGPMSIANGVSVTVPSGSAWTIV